MTNSDIWLSQDDDEKWHLTLQGWWRTVTSDSPRWWRIVTSDSSRWWRTVTSDSPRWWRIVTFTSPRWWRIVTSDSPRMMTNSDIWLTQDDDEQLHTQECHINRTDISWLKWTFVIRTRHRILNSSVKSCRTCILCHVWNWTLYNGQPVPFIPTTDRSNISKYISGEKNIIYDYIQWSLP